MSSKGFMYEKIKVFLTPLWQRGQNNFVIQNAMVSVIRISANEPETALKLSVDSIIIMKDS